MAPSSPSIPIADASWRWVNEKLALSVGAQPCSTTKVAVALAALSENIITKDTQVPLGKYWKVDLTTALAKSNNPDFEAVGRKLGFEKLSYYERQFGLGELAGLNIPGESPGILIPRPSWMSGWAGSARCVPLARASP